jgi:hypothetical protein
MKSGASHREGARLMAGIIAVKLLFGHQFGQLLLAVYEECE